MIHESKRRLLRAMLVSLVALPSLHASAQQQPGTTATKASAAPEETCQPEPALEAQINEGEAALERIFMGTGDEHAKLRAAAEDAYAVIVFPHVAKVGFFVTAAQGKGLLSYKDKEGHWSHPIVVSGRMTSVGPHFSMQVIDTMIVAKTQEALLRLLTGRPPGQTGPAQGTQIATYSSNMGLTAGVSLDDYLITIDQDANQGLYCRPILAEDIVREGHKVTLKPPPCAQKFAQTMNRAAGKAPITRKYQ
jgi:lipid-binding SYLF domain-containing protein